MKNNGNNNTDGPQNQQINQQTIGQEDSTNSIIVTPTDAAQNVVLTHWYSMRKLKKLVTVINEEKTNEKAKKEKEKKKEERRKEKKRGKRKRF